MTTFTIAYIYESYLSTGDGQLVPTTVVYDVKYIAQYVESNVQKNNVMNSNVNKKTQRINESVYKEVLMFPA